MPTAIGPYSEKVAQPLVEYVWIVSVVNPSRIKGEAQSELARNKTDRADTALLARFCAAMRPGLRTPPSPAYRKLRAMVERLQALKDNLSHGPRGAAQNFVHAETGGVAP